MSNQALFYPYIDINDEQWLKTSLLYWDEIRTIVPETIKNPYQSNTTEALYDMELLTPIRVNSNMNEIEDLAESVLAYLSTNEGSRIVASNGQQNSIIHSEKLPYQLRDFTRIHPEKLPFRIREELSYIFKEVDQNGYLHVNNGFANF